jgi:hypothetical protein
MIRTKALFVDRQCLPKQAFGSASLPLLSSAVPRLARSAPSGTTSSARAIVIASNISSTNADLDPYIAAAPGKPREAPGEIASPDTQGCILPRRLGEMRAENARPRGRPTPGSRRSIAGEKLPAHVGR